MFHTCSVVDPVTLPFGLEFLIQVLVFLSCSENPVFERNISRDGFPLLLPGNTENATKCNNMTNKHLPHRSKFSRINKFNVIERLN